MRIKKKFPGVYQKKLFYGSCIVLWLSGALWIFLKMFYQRQDEINSYTHPAQPWLLECHGAVAIIFLIVFGSLIDHMFPGWQNNRQRQSGFSLIISCAVLIITGWGLYYLGNEKYRNLTSIIHCVVGMLLPVVIFLHVWKIISQRRSKVRSM